jgi:HK97 family phage portal protein
VRELAFESAANLIAKSISKCEFRTFKNGTEVRGQEYYLWNVEPNRNQASSVFLHKWLHQLLRYNEALIIEPQPGQLLVADSFTRKPYALYDDLFSDVVVGDLTFRETFKGPEVLYVQLAPANMRLVTEGLYHSYRQLITYTVKAYQTSRGRKGKLKISALASQAPDFQTTLQDMTNQRLKTFFANDNAVLPLLEGWDYDELQQKTYANDSTRDIRALIDDVSDFTAKAYGIAPKLLRGDAVGLKDSTDFTLTFCIDPLVDMLQEEINRKRYGRQLYLAGDKLVIDTRAIKHIDLLSSATSIDKLIGSGAFSVNDVLRLTGGQEIDEPWANAHYITKNYALAADALAAAGGDADA